MNSFFISAAEAADGATPSGGLIMQYVILFGVLFWVWYIMLIRPHKKKQAQHQEMLGKLKKGDRVVSIGGIHGLVSQVKEHTVLVKVSAETQMEFNRSSISMVNPQAQKADKDDRGK